MKLYPSLLSDSVREIQGQIDSIVDLEDISTVQIDVIDGIFADNITITPADIPLLDLGRLQYDAHFMTIEPLDFLYELIGECDKSQVRACIAQVEKLSFQVPFLEETRQQQWKAGLSLDLFTPLSAIDDESWALIDVLQLMSIEAGAQGSPFREQVFEKITEAQERIAKLDHKVELIIDGGIKQEQLPRLQELGVESIAVGSALWKAEDATVAAEAFLKG
jgi:ribulose-phosphate 3-epimerase